MRYTKEFKDEAVKLCLQPDANRREIADNLGVKYKTICSWIYKELKDMGWKVTQPRVSKRMKLLGLHAKAARKHKKTTDSNHNKHVYDNLLEQNFTALSVNHRWVTDITYVPTQEGWLYLYSGEFFRTVFSQKIDVKLSKILSILTLPKYTSAGVL
ncbi:hypothetical protein fh0823_25230 [Francisella halioticida]|nr:hypothetical protein fh0823_25230 [Francisella halioticida]